MAEYVSRVGNGIYKIIFGTKNKDEYQKVQDVIREIIDNNSIKPNNNGNWMHLSTYRDDEGCLVNDFMCSKCNTTISGVPEPYPLELPNYCFNCGAKMKNYD